jgi:hypothetical protein
LPELDAAEAFDARVAVDHRKSGIAWALEARKIPEKMVNADCGTRVGRVGRAGTLIEIFVFPVT